VLPLSLPNPPDMDKELFDLVCSVDPKRFPSPPPKERVAVFVVGEFLVLVESVGVQGLLSASAVSCNFY
jgi:hypothetical protein